MINQRNRSALKRIIYLIMLGFCINLIIHGQNSDDTEKNNRANNLYREAITIAKQGTMEARLAGVKKLEQARNLYLEIKHNQSADYCLQSIRILGNDINKDGLEVMNAPISDFDEAVKNQSNAVSILKESIVIYDRMRLPEWAALFRITIGWIDISIGDLSDALVVLEEARKFYSQSGQTSSEATATKSLGWVYSNSGDWANATKYISEALRLYKIVGDQNGIAGALTNLGDVFGVQGKNLEAISYYEKALEIRKNKKQIYDIALISAALGKNHQKLKNYSIALKYFQEALPVMMQYVGRDGFISDALDDIGKLFADQGNFLEALKYYKLALEYAKSSTDLNYLGRAYGNLMDLMEERSLFLASIYGKYSINAYQQYRTNLRKLNLEQQNTYIKKVEGTYRKLVEILVSQGRLFEAQQILAMLKEDEYSNYIRRDADEIKKLSTRADLRPDEQAALAKYEELAGNVTQYGTQFTKLEELKNKQGADFKQQAEYKALKAKLDEANAAFRIFLDKGLTAELGKSAKKEIEFDRALQAKLQTWGKGTVALYTIAGEDRYRVILTTPKTQVDGKTEIKVADLNKKIFEFRAALQNPAIDPRPLGKELYDILIKPIEKDLEGAQAKTLLWSLDGTLRYIPIAALSPDGIHYLAQKYQTVVVTSTIRQNLVSETNSNWQLLGAGVSKESKVIEPNGTEEIRFKALPGVESELLKIVRQENAKTEETGVLSGKRMMDEGFNLTSLEEGMSQRPNNKPKYNVIHLATHFRLGSDTSKSFLLLGSNQALTLEKVSDDTLLNFGEVELVTLSACNTGFGTATENKAFTKEQERKMLEQNNGVEVDSLATFIELRGAKSVMATLWAVADESTSLLMSEFYRLKKENPNLSKSEAIQQAQQAMIEGKLKASEKNSGCLRSDPVNLDGSVKFECDQKAPYSHPYFWSPFILIGNWR